jgi:L-malate glycosyltransferase
VHRSSLSSPAGIGKSTLLAFRRARGSRVRIDGVRVLYVNHTSEMSGAEHSLLGLLGALPPEVAGLLACPEGRLAGRARARAIDVAALAAITGGPRLSSTGPRVAVQLGRGSLRLAQVTRAQRVDLVHANSMRAAVLCCIGRPLLGVPVLAHVRDVFEASETSTRLMRALVAARADAIIFNSDYTRRRFWAGIGRVRSRAAQHVVPNGVDLSRFAPRLGELEARRRLRLPVGRRLLGVIAQMTPWKGQADAIRILADLCDTGVDAHLVLAGAAKFVSRVGRYDHEAYAASLHRLVAHHGLDDRVSFLGDCDPDVVPALLEALDVVLVPSLREPFGRGVIEALAAARPVIATDVGGPREILGGGDAGILLAPAQPARWADAVRALLADPASARARGRRGRMLAESRYGSDHHAARVVSAYRSLVDDATRSARVAGEHGPGRAHAEGDALVGP